MAVTKIQRKDHGRGRDSADSQELEQRWQVWVDDPVNAAAQVLQYAGLPKKGDAYSVSLPSFRCIDRDVQSISQTPKVLMLVCKFSTKYDAAKMEAKELKPLDRRPVISWTSQTLTVPFVKDMVTDEALTNSAKDPISGQTREVSIICYDATVNTDVQPDWLLDLLDTINDSDVSIRGRMWPTETLLLRSASCSDQMSEMDQLYFKVGVKILANPLGWKSKILDAGLYQLIGSGLTGTSGTRERCKIGEHEVTQPVPLDGEGVMVPFADLLADPVNNVKWIEKYKNKTADFTAIGLPPLPL